MSTTRTRSGASTVSAEAALRALDRDVTACASCELHRDRTTPVTGAGPVDAGLVVVTTVPGRHEDLTGSPLAGAPRNVLDHAMTSAGIDVDAVRVTSVVRCRPVDDRTPTAEEIRTCAAHLRRELEVVSPRVVVTLGATATAVVLGRPVPLDRVAGYRLDVLDGITLVPTYHPADAVRGGPRVGRDLRRDLAVAQAVLDGRMASGAQALAELRAALSGS